MVADSVCDDTGDTIMMRRIADLFVWFCVASLLAQLCILVIVSARGNLNQKTIANIIAALNGIDVQSEKLKGVLISAREAPIPTYEDVVSAKVKSSLELDSRQEALDRLQRQISDRERVLRDEIERFDVRKSEFQLELAKIRDETASENLNQIVQFFTNLGAEQAKSQLLLLLKNNQKGDVVAILKTLPSDKQKKLLAEFTNEQDQQPLSEIIQELQNTSSIDSIIDKAKPGIEGG
jgi:hypothetical protein